MESDLAYFSRRSREEREAAIRTLHPAARRAHVGMAERYDELAAAIRSNHSMLENPAAGAAEA